MSLRTTYEPKAVDWNDLVNNPKKFKKELIENFEKDGFVIIDNSPLAEFCETAEEATRAFFKNDPELKKILSVPGNDNEGFHIPKKTDRKETHHLGHHTREAMKKPEERTLETLDDYAEEQVKKLKTNFRYFSETIAKHFDLGVKTCKTILSVFEEYLDLEEGSLINRTKSGNHISRQLYYPAELKDEVDDLGRKIPVKEDKEIKNEDVVQKFRAKAHGDTGLLTAIAPAKEPGLQLAKNQPLSRSYGPKSDLENIAKEDWHTVEYKPGRIVIHAGHELTTLTNGFIPSTIHRVTHISYLQENFPEVAANIDVEKFKKLDRYAIPFFFHANADEKMTAIPETVARRNGINLFENGKNITVKEYVEAQNEFDGNRQLCVDGEHPSVFLKEYQAKNALA